MKNYIALLFTLLLLFANSQVTRQWVATYNGSGDFNDRYTCVTTDGSGNIYLGGSTTNPGSNRDYLIVKMNSSGVLQWNKQFKGAAEGADEVTAIAIDGSGNVYVTGFAKGDNTSEDYLTVKMNSNGDSLWAHVYDFAGEYDQANSIFVDLVGNVYVTGQSDRDSSFIINDDYATIKYNSSGTQQWVQRFNGFGGGTDRAVKVVADDSSNVYVTGRSDNGNDDDYVTIKYNGSGVQQWIKYDDRGGRDRATAMFMDASANIYITGRSDNGSNDDFWTLKYNRGGTLQWQVAYDFVENDRASAITVDVSGNVFVTGESDADASPLLNYDYQTVGYNSTGTQLWQKRYNGTGSNDDFPFDISVSGSNIYVTGKADADAGTATLNDMVTISYAASNGNENWTTVFAGAGNQDDAGNAIAAIAGGCIVAGYTEDNLTRRDALAINYNTGGFQQWSQPFNGIGDNNENVRSIAIDASNNVYAAGYAVETGSDRNMALVKFSPSGNFVCKYSRDGSSTGSVDDALAVELDNNGNPAIAGVTKNSGTSNDMTYFKLDANTCDTVWLKIRDGSGHGSDKIYDMARDASGNFYITGRTDADPSGLANDNCYTAKIDGNGTTLWAQTYNSSGSNEDRGIFVHVASTGNVYVSGRSWNGTDYDIFILKYNSAGAQQWVQTYHGGNGNDEPRDLALDAAENTYLCGIAEEVTDSVYDYVTLKYNSAGVQQWARKYNGTGNGDDKAIAIAVDNNSNVLITGESDVNITSTINYDMVTVKYDVTGIQQWAKNFNGAANLEDNADDVAVNNANQIYVTGHSNKGTDALPDYDAVTMILDALGNTLWSDIYNSPSDSSDVPNLILLNGNDFYVGGSTVEGNQMRNMMVIKYSGSPLGIQETLQNGDFQIFPNPFNNTLHVTTNQEKALYELSNCLGEKVFEKEITSGDNLLHLPSISSGIYFYQIRHNSLITSGKICHFKN